MSSASTDQIGQFNKLIEAPGDGQPSGHVLGGIRKTHVFTTMRPDFRALALAAPALVNLKDDEILRAVAEEIEKRDPDQGVDVRFVRHPCRTRHLDLARAQQEGMDDIRYGWDIGKQIGLLDIGQCVVVKDRVIVAVEAVEADRRGDSPRRRVGPWRGRRRERCKPQQDLRFDLPAVGPRTIETMEAVKASVLALEAGRSILLDREVIIEKADRAGIAIVGYGADAERQG
ncbi:MAG: UDP-2,3-diacylglucosamine diphosphatase LpxI [Nitrospiraceae bacterium]